MLNTDRSWRVLLKQRDLHAILLLVTLDLALTVHGITTGAGTESNPFFAPLTGSMGGMAAGILFYYGVLLAASWAVTGGTRRVLASVVFGMHVAGAVSWVGLLTSLPQNWWYYLLLGTGGTALFYAGYERVW